MTSVMTKESTMTSVKSAMTSFLEISHYGPKEEIGEESHQA